MIYGNFELYGKEKMKINISIIIPVYNAGIYLQEALESIFNQSFHEFELICIDDASNDKLTKDILLKYQSTHKNMHIIWLEKNKGAGEARNIGFRKVKGKYVMFLDADDIFNKDFLEKTYQSISINKADICVCGHEEFFTENEKRHLGLKWIPSRDKLEDNIGEDCFLNISTAAWDKLCRTEFLKENNIFFQSLPSCNDILFSCRVMMNATKVCCVEESLVLYRTKTGNQISTHRNPVDLYKAMMSLYEIEKKRCEKDLLLSQIGALLLRNGVWELCNCNNEIYKQQYYVLVHEFFCNNKIEFQNKLLEIFAANIRGSSREWKWIYKDMDFLNQLRMTGQKLKEKIKGQNQLFLWGLGYRGKIFQQFCKEEEIQLQGVADKKNKNIGGRTEYGNKIVSTGYVLQSDGVVIASNKEIYKYLLKSNLSLINLDEYCLF